MSIIASPGLGPIKCVHGRAKAEGRCKTCGVITRSHRAEGAMPATTLCPDCGETVTLLVPAMLCHRHYVAAQSVKQPEEL